MDIEGVYAAITVYKVHTLFAQCKSNASTHEAVTINRIRKTNMCHTLVTNYFFVTSDYI